MRQLFGVGLLLILWSHNVFGEDYKQEFVSPDKSCRILYVGASDHGEGTFYDTSNGKKTKILKEYVRVGPQINWLGNSLAELFFSEGSPAYHSEFYDCKEKRISPSYFLSIALEQKTRVVAELNDEEIVLYDLFSKKEFYRAKAPGVGLISYFNCESDTWFEGTDSLHIKMKCYDGNNVDLKIKVPNKPLEPTR
jgi:hypothetical protein